MDSCKLKFPSSSLDAVISAETLEHVLEPEKVLKEISRVLKKSGILVLRFPNKQSKFKNLLTRLIGRPRFEIIEPNLSNHVKGNDEDLCYKASTSDVIIFLRKQNFKIIYTKPFFWPSALIVARKN
ncbi:MAG: methyltransferase domain-containing protein [Candidatus Pacearchaeota archaeon]|nr:methyltransferase domain-containing protein [Candidatus Pacearchaeota archaeon]